MVARMRMVRTTTAAHWLGIDPAPTTTIEALVLRYLGAFGPASVADVAAWSRLERFDPSVVGDLLEARRLVRIVVMRGTIHLVTAEDARLLRPLTQPVMDAELARHPEFGPHLRGVDLAPLLLSLIHI